MIICVMLQVLLYLISNYTHDYTRFQLYYAVDLALTLSMAAAAAPDTAGGEASLTYIENIFLCLALPLILSLFFMKGRVRAMRCF